jgi:hypothetical protein
MVGTLMKGPYLPEEIDPEPHYEGVGHLPRADGGNVGLFQFDFRLVTDSTPIIASQILNHYKQCLILGVCVGGGYIPLITAVGFQNIKHVISLFSSLEINQNQKQTSNLYFKQGLILNGVASVMV